MNDYQCTVCHYIYFPDKGDPDNGVAENTPFSELPSDWVCPICGVAHDSFKELESAQVGK